MRAAISRNESQPPKPALLKTHLNCHTDRRDMACSATLWSAQLFLHRVVKLSFVETSEKFFVLSEMLRLLLGAILAPLFKLVSADERDFWRSPRLARRPAHLQKQD